MLSCDDNWLIYITADTSHIHITSQLTHHSWHITSQFTSHHIFTSNQSWHITSYVHCSVLYKLIITNVFSFSVCWVYFKITPIISSVKRFSLYTKHCLTTQGLYVFGSESPTIFAASSVDLSPRKYSALSSACFLLLSKRQRYVSARCFISSFSLQYFAPVNW